MVIESQSNRIESKSNRSCNHSLTGQSCTVASTSVAYHLVSETAVQLTLEHVEPVRLPVVLGREDACVDQHEYDDEPIEPLRLDRLATGSPTSTSPLDDPPPARNHHHHHCHHHHHHKYLYQQRSYILQTYQSVQPRVSLCNVVYIHHVSENK